MKHLYVASLLKKDTGDLIDSIKVVATDKYDAIAAANRAFREIDPNYFHHSNVWVELEKENVAYD